MCRKFVIITVIKQEYISEMTGVMLYYEKQGSYFISTKVCLVCSILANIRNDKLSSDLFVTLKLLHHWKDFDELWYREETCKLLQAKSICTKLDKGEIGWEGMKVVWQY